MSGPLRPVDQEGPCHFVVFWPALVSQRGFCPTFGNPAQHKLCFDDDIEMSVKCAMLWRQL